MVVYCLAANQLVVVGMWRIVYHCRANVDVYPQTLVILTSIPTQQYCICVWYDSRYVGFSRTYRMDAVGRDIVYHGGLLFSC